MKQKSGIKTRIITGLLALVLMVSCFTTACQPTPEESAVQSKSNGNLDKALAQDAKKIVIEAPETVKCEYDAKAENTKIVIDAKVTYPEAVEKLAVQEIVPTSIDNEFIKKAADTCFGNSIVYEPNNEPSKADIKKCLSQIEERMSDEYLDAAYGDDEATKTNVYNSRKSVHDALLKYYKKAPKTVQEVKPDYTLKPSKYWMDQRNANCNRSSRSTQ